jgi:hypothetical protein
VTAPRPWTRRKSSQPTVPVLLRPALTSELRLSLPPLSPRYTAGDLWWRVAAGRWTWAWDRTWDWKGARAVHFAGLPGPVGTPDGGQGIESGTITLWVPSALT